MSRPRRFPRHRRTRSRQKCAVHGSRSTTNSAQRPKRVRSCLLAKRCSARMSPISPTLCAKAGLRLGYCAAKASLSRRVAALAGPWRWRLRASRVAASKPSCRWRARRTSCLAIMQGNAGARRSRHSAQPGRHPLRLRPWRARYARAMKRWRHAWRPRKRVWLAVLAFVASLQRVGWARRLAGQSSPSSSTRRTRCRTGPSSSIAVGCPVRDDYVFFDPPARRCSAAISAPSRSCSARSSTALPGDVVAHSGEVVTINGKAVGADEGPDPLRRTSDARAPPDQSLPAVTMRAHRTVTVSTAAMPTSASCARGRSWDRECRAVKRALPSAAAAFGGCSPRSSWRGPIAPIAAGLWVRPGRRSRSSSPTCWRRSRPACRTRRRVASSRGSMRPSQNVPKQRSGARTQSPASRQRAEARTWNFDPTVQIEHDMRDQKGNLIAAAGQRINPLDFVAIRQDLVFIDGDDRREIAWATVAFHGPESEDHLREGLADRADDCAEAPLLLRPVRQSDRHFGF